MALPLDDMVVLIDYTLRAITQIERGDMTPAVRTVVRIVLNDAYWPDPRVRDEVALEAMRTIMVYEDHCGWPRWGSVLHYLYNVRFNECPTQPDIPCCIEHYQALDKNPTTVNSLEELLIATARVASNDEARQAALRLAFAYLRSVAEK